MDEGSLKAELEFRFGFRRIHSDWLRRHSTFSPDVLEGLISRTDLRSLTHGGLPWRVSEGHNITIGCRLLVQVEDVINIANADPRKASPNCVLQLVLTDGCQEFVAVQLRPVPQLKLTTRPGTKVVLGENTAIRRGRVLLTPDFVVSVLAEPPENVWGSQYEERVRNALQMANLPVPNVSSFDVLAARGRALSRNASSSRTVCSIAPPGQRPGRGNAYDVNSARPVLVTNVGDIAPVNVAGENVEDDDDPRGTSSPPASSDLFDDPAFWEQATAVAD